MSRFQEDSVGLHPRLVPFRFSEMLAKYQLCDFCHIRTENVQQSVQRARGSFCFAKLSLYSLGTCKR